MLTRLITTGFGLLAAPVSFAQTVPPSSPVQAAPEFEPIQIIRSVTMDDLRYLLDEVGAKFIAAGRTGEGAPFVFGEFDDGLTFGAYAVCAIPSGEDCRGVELMAVYATDAGNEVISGIDRDYPAISLYRSDDQKVRVSRYVILDHGISWDNLVENANVFRMLCGKVSERLAMLTPASAAPEWE